MAIGIASLGATLGIANVFDAVTSANLREWLAADLSVITGEDVDAEQKAFLEQMQREGVDSTVVIDSVAQATSERVPSPQVVMARVVDPARYPFYGKVRLSGGLNTATALDSESAAVSEDLLFRLQVRVGGRIEVNRVRLRVVAVIESVPDQLALPPNPLPKVLLSREAAAQTGLLRWHGVDYQRVLLRIPAGGDVMQVRRQLEAAFPGRKVLDSLHPSPLVSGAIRTAKNAVSAIGLLALLVGVLGMAIALWSHLEQRLDQIATQKMLGATSRKIFLIYGFETFFLALTACGIGFAGSLAVERAAAVLMPGLLALRISLPWDWRGPLNAAWQGLLAGSLVMAPVFWKIRTVRPYSMIRRAVADPRLQPQDVFYRRPTVVSLLGLLLLIAAFQNSWRGRLALFAGVLFLGMLIAALTALAVHALDTLCRRFRGMPVAVHYGIGNILRPGNHARACIAAMSVAMTLLTTIYLIGRAASNELEDQLFFGSASLLLINVQPEEAEPLKEFLQSQNGVTSAPAIFPFLVARAAVVDGKPVQELPTALEAGLERRWLTARTGQAPPIFELLEGAWWQASDPEPQVALPRPAARALGARVGSRIEFEAGATRFTARLSALYRAGPLDRLLCCFLFNEITPLETGVIWHGMVGISPGGSAAIRAAIYRKFPTITTVDSAGMMDLFQQWLSSVLWFVRLVAGIAMGGATILVGAAMAGSLRWRSTEVAIWRALGAEGRHVRLTHLVEFSAMGLASGCIGAAVASSFTALGWGWLSHGEFALPAPGFAAAAMALGLAIANGSGWLAVRRALRMKPLQTLRGE